MRNCYICQAREEMDFLCPQTCTFLSTEQIIFPPLAFPGQLAVGGPVAEPRGSIFGKWIQRIPPAAASPISNPQLQQHLHSQLSGPEALQVCQWARMGFELEGCGLEGPANMMMEEGRFSIPAMEQTWHSPSAQEASHIGDRYSPRKRERESRLCWPLPGLTPEQADSRVLWSSSLPTRAPAGPFRYRVRSGSKKSNHLAEINGTTYGAAEGARDSLPGTATAQQGQQAFQHPGPASNTFMNCYATDVQAWQQLAANSCDPLKMQAATGTQPWPAQKTSKASTAHSASRGLAQTSGVKEQAQTCSGPSKLTATSSAGTSQASRASNNSSSSALALQPVFTASRLLRLQLLALVADEARLAKTSPRALDQLLRGVLGCNVDSAPGGGLKLAPPISWAQQNRLDQLSAQLEEQQASGTGLACRQHLLLDCMEDLARLCKGSGDSLPHEAHSCSSRLGMEFASLPISAQWAGTVSRDERLTLPKVRAALQGHDQPSGTAARGSHVAKGLLLKDLMSTTSAAFKQRCLQVVTESRVPSSQIVSEDMGARAQAMKKVALLASKQAALGLAFAAQQPICCLEIHTLLPDCQPERDPSFWNAVVEAGLFSEEQRQAFWTVWDTALAQTAARTAVVVALRERMQEALRQIPPEPTEDNLNAAEAKLGTLARQMKAALDAHAGALLAAEHWTSYMLLSPVQVGAMQAKACPLKLWFRSIAKAGAVPRAA